MRQRLVFILGLNLVGIVLTAMLWHILATGIVIDSTGLHLTNGQDFLNFWGAPQIAAIDPSVLFTGRGYELALHRIYNQDFAQLRWSYPLHSLFFYAPFSWMSYAPAVALWLVSGLALYLAVTAQAFPAALRLWAMILLFTAPVTLIELITRQNGFFIGAASLAVLVLLERKRPVAAGMLLGCLTIKPQLFILWPIMLAMRREWRCLAVALLTTLLLIAASVAVYGIDAWADYLFFVIDKQWRLLSAEEFNETRKLYHLMMPGVTPALRIFGLPDGLVSLIQGLVSLGVAVGTFLAFRKPLDFTQRALILSTASLLVSPYSFNYDMTLLTAALLLFWSARPQLSLYERTMTGIVYLLPLLVYILNVTDMPVAPVFLLLLFLHTLREAATFTPHPQ